jgi:DNA-binding NtrC family response regulator
VAGISPAAMQVLQEHGWPGNVRELQNAIERATALAEGPLIEVHDLPLDLMLPRDGGAGGRPERLKEARDHFERQLILRVFERVRWNHSEAARVLGVHRNSLAKRLAALGLRFPDAAP